MLCLYISRCVTGSMIHYQKRWQRFASVKKTLCLDGGRVLVVLFRGDGLVPSVNLFTCESTQCEDLHLTIYPSEFEKLKSSIQEYIDYMQNVHDEGDVQLTRMATSILQRADSVVREEAGSFLVDCSRSHIWLLVRYCSGVHNEIQPQTVMEKERLYPIQLAFKVEDFAKMGCLLKEIEVLFRQEKLKQSLLEKWLTSRLVNIAGRQTVSGIKRRINLISDLESGDLECNCPCGVEVDSA